MACGGDITVDVITCSIFGDCRLRDVGVVRGVTRPCHGEVGRAGKGKDGTTGRGVEGYAGLDSPPSPERTTI